MIDFTISELHISELFYVKMVHGVELFLTSGSTPVIFKGDTYIPSKIKRGSIKHTVEITVPELEITLGIDALNVDGRNVLAMAKDGYFDSAEVHVVAYEHKQNTHEYLWRGNIAGEIESTLSEVTLKVKTVMHYFEETIPKIVYQRKCNHILFDTLCRADKDAYRVDCSISTLWSANKRILISTALADLPLNWLRNGVINVTSGANAGQSRRIMLSAGKEETEGSTPEEFVRYAMSSNEYSIMGALYVLMPTFVGLVYLDKPFWNSFAVGDTFSVWPGCDKTSEMCKNKFNNLNNFLGFEYIPESDTALKV